MGGAVGLLFGAIAPSDVPRLRFTVLGTPTSSNPINAVRQGLADEPISKEYLITGDRCSKCGFLELYAVKQ